MTTPPLSVLAKPVMSVATAIWPRIRRRYKERQAGELPTGAGDYLEKGLDESLRRLIGGQIEEDGWWSGLLTRIEHAFITPDFLTSPALQEWLAERQTQEDLKSLARSQITGAKEDERIRAELRRRYSKSTGELEQLADGPIDVVIAILAAGYFSPVDARTEPVIGLMQATAQEMRASMAGVSEQLNSIAQAIAPDQHTVAAHSQVAGSTLEKALKSRAADPTAAANQIVVLAQRVMSGDLVHASQKIKAEVLFWAARLHTGETSQLPTAKKYLAQLNAMSPDFDARIVEALIESAEGDHDKAVRHLYQIGSADARSAIFFVLIKSRGSAAALEWFDGEDGRDSAAFFTGIGWCNLAFHLAQAGRWQEAANRIAVARSLADEWPDVLFVEGVLNSALLLPEDLRPHALRMELFHPWVRTVDSPEAKRHRALADDSFRRAEELLSEIHVGRAKAAAKWRLWLRLSNPDRSVSEAARAEVREAMKNGQAAVDLIAFARGFQIEFDETPLRRVLTQKMKAGGLEGREVLADFMLAELKMAPAERAEYFEREEGRLAEVLTRSTIIGKRIEALVEDNQPERARRLLIERKADLADTDTRPLEVMIAAREGVDPRPRLESLYAETKSLASLHSLVSFLGSKKDWVALLPRLDELFKRERTVENALRFIDCIQRAPSASDDDIVSFTDDIEDLVSTNYEIASARAWALFSTGKWRDAKEINDRLLMKRHDPPDVSLDINIAIQTGDWERFAAIVDREWPYRDKLDPPTLFRLATLAAEVDATANRAAELARLAAHKSPDDPKVLISAYALFVQLGRDADADAEWVPRAASLSSEEGPVWRVDIKTLVEEMAPAHRERERKVLDALNRGELMLGAAAQALNMPLSRLLIQVPSRTTAEQDARRWTVVPILAGGRPATPIKKEMSIGLDVTSIMLLGFLGRLREVLSYFRQVVLSPDAFALLLEERRRVRFHQPSLVAQAEQILTYINSSKISVANVGLRPPGWLVDEVGRELADLLQAARVGRGVTVRPGPIHRLRTYMEEEADLREYSQQLISTLTFVDAIYKSGYIDESSYRHARRYLEGHDRMGSAVEITLDAQTEIFLDSLALNHLHTAGLLPIITATELSINVHPEVPREMSELINANLEGERLSDQLNQIRITLRAALADGKAIFLNRSSTHAEMEGIGGLTERLVTVVDFVRNTSQADVVCADDRAVNRHGFVTDKKNRVVPIASSIDVLSEVLSVEEYRSVLHQLRRAGMALLPVDAGELQSRVLSAGVDSRGRLVESAELRTLRQSLMRLRSLDTLRPEFEGVYIGALQFSSIIAIRGIWTSPSVSVDHALRASDWIWENICPSPLDWIPRQSPAAATAADAYGRHLGLLLEPLVSLDADRQESLLAWIENQVLGPLLPTNPDLVDRAATVTRAAIERIVNDISTRKAIGDC